MTVKHRQARKEQNMWKVNKNCDEHDLIEFWIAAHEDTRVTN